MPNRLSLNQTIVDSYEQPLIDKGAYSPNKHWFKDNIKTYNTQLSVPLSIPLNITLYYSIYLQVEMDGCEKKCFASPISLNNVSKCGNEWDN